MELAFHSSEHGGSHVGVDLRTASDIFVTFLYAASIHLLIAVPHAAKILSWPVSTLLLLAILHLFSDWLSRVRLPRLLPPTDELDVLVQMAKSVAEVAGLLFLLLAWIALIDSSSNPQPIAWVVPFNSQLAFAVFLLLTFLWNLVLLVAMQQLSWEDLTRFIISGTALKSDKLDFYGKRVVGLRDKLMRLTDHAGQDIKNVVGRFILSVPFLFFDGCLRVIVQLVSIHIAWTSLFVSALLVIRNLPQEYVALF